MGEQQNCSPIFLSDKELCLCTDIFFNLRSFSDSAAEVVKLSATNLTLADNVNCYYVGRVEGERLLNATTVSDSSYSESRRNACLVTSDNSTLVHLNSFSRTLYDLVVYTNRVTDFELGYLCFELLVCKSLNKIHKALLKIRMFMRALQRTTLILLCFHTRDILYHICFAFAIGNHKKI